MDKGDLFSPLFFLKITCILYLYVLQYNYSKGKEIHKNGKNSKLVNELWLQ